MTTTGIIGATGMVGSRILSTLLAKKDVSQVDVIARRNPTSLPAEPQSKLTTFVEPDAFKWADKVRTLSPAPSVFFSGFGTTRAAAGGFDNQYKLEHGVNVDVAKAAKENGAKVYVLISSSGASKTSAFGYTKMKGEIEEDIKALGFDTTVIVRPGLIAGTREESRPSEAVVRFVANWAGKLSDSLKDPWAQDAEVIGKAAVQAGLLAAEGKVPAGSEKVWELSGKDIVRLGRTEWSE